MLTARQKAWETRREKYGARGHGGAYSRPNHPLGMRALRLVLRLYEDGTLSEGQCCKALDLDRVEFRAIADAAKVRATSEPQPRAPLNVGDQSREEPSSPSSTEGGAVDG